MLVLGFDTATDATAVAVARDGETLFEVSVERGGDGRPAHATRLLAEIERAVGEAGGWDEVDRLAVGVGPGSFTGLRIGISTARALAQAAGLELAGVGTLAALARGAAGEAEGRPVLAVLDARRGEAFAALYESGGEELWAPWVGAPAQLGERLGALREPPLAAGSGVLRFRDELRKRGAEIPDEDHPSHRLSAVQVCAIGARDAGGFMATAEPLYLRRPDAERWRERDRKDS